MYFESVIGNRAYCDAHVLSFQPLLPDLSKASTHAELLLAVAEPVHTTAMTRPAPTATRAASPRSTGSCRSGSRRS